MAINAWNPSDATASAWTLSNANLTATAATFGNIGIRSVNGASSGKQYFEFTIGSTITAVYFGIANASASLNGTYSQAGLACANSGGSIFYNGTAGPTGAGVVANGTVCFAVDLGAQLFWCRMSAAGQWNFSGTANPSTGTGGLPLTGVAGGGTTGLAMTGGANILNQIVTLNAGDSAFVGVVPSGFAAGFPGAAPGGAGTQALAMVLA